MQTISVVIVNYNGLSVLVNCLKTLKSSFKYLCEVVIVDNGSTDGSKLFLQKYAAAEPLARVIFNTKNNGFAEANNQGVHKTKGKYVLFLNNDTLLTASFLPKMRAVLESNDDCAAVQPLILFPDLTIDSVGSYMTPTGFLYHKAHRQEPNNINAVPSQTYSLKGACMLWKKTVFEELGGFNESYFAYFEETDLCHRAINAGYTLLFTPTAKIIHLGGFTSKNMQQDFIQFYNTKNRIQTLIAELPLLDAVRIATANILLTQFLAIWSLFSSVKLAYAIQIGLAAGIFNGVTTRIKVKKERVALSSLLKKPDFSYYQALFSSLKNYNKIW